MMRIPVGAPARELIRQFVDNEFLVHNVPNPDACTCEGQQTQCSFCSLQFQANQFSIVDEARG